MWGEIGKQFIKPRTHIATCNYSWHWLVLRLIIATVWSDFHILTETFSYLRKIPFHELSLVADFSVYFVFYSCIIIGKLSQFEFSLCMRGYGFLNRKLSFFSFSFFLFLQRSDCGSSYKTACLEQLQCMLKDTSVSHMLAIIGTWNYCRGVLLTCYYANLPRDNVMVTRVTSSTLAVNKMQINLMCMQLGNRTFSDARMEGIIKGQSAA